MSYFLSRLPTVNQKNITDYMLQYDDTEFDYWSLARVGCLSGMKWKLKHGHKMRYTAMDYAARNGHLDVVKWLHENIYLFRDN